MQQRTASIASVGHSKPEVDNILSVSREIVFQKAREGSPPCLGLLPKKTASPTCLSCPHLPLPPRIPVRSPPVGLRPRHQRLEEVRASHIALGGAQLRQRGVMRRVKFNATWRRTKKEQGGILEDSYELLPGSTRQHDAASICAFWNC